jgi:formylmethanofuran dehydrogenase subunit C
MRPASITAVLAVAMLSGGCFVIHHLGAPAVHGSGTKAAQTRKLPAFSGIEFNGAGQVTAKVGGEPSITLEIDDNLLDIITTEVHDGRLIISSSESYSTSLGLTATVTAPELESYCQRGSGDVVIEGVQGDRFAAELFGAGNIRASGNAGRATANIAGSGNIDLTGLSAKDVTAEIRGSGDVRIGAAQTLSASIFGSGNIRYHGDPKVQHHIFGSGTVRKE